MRRTHLNFQSVLKATIKPLYTEVAKLGLRFLYSMGNYKKNNQSSLTRKTTTIGDVSLDYLENALKVILKFNVFFHKLHFSVKDVIASLK